MLSFKDSRSSKVDTFSERKENITGELRNKNTLIQLYPKLVTGSIGSKPVSSLLEIFIL